MSIKTALMTRFHPSQKVKERGSFALQHPPLSEHFLTAGTWRNQSPLLFLTSPNSPQQRDTPRASRADANLPSKHPIVSNSRTCLIEGLMLFLQLLNFRIRTYFIQNVSWVSRRHNSCSLASNKCACNASPCRRFRSFYGFLLPAADCQPSHVV